MTSDTELPPLTAAEREALTYILSRGDRVYSSSLYVIYEQRYRAECAAEGKHPYIGGGRRGAWKRTSGSVMARLQRKGYLSFSNRSAYDNSYVPTEAGRQALVGKVENDG